MAVAHGTERQAVQVRWVLPAGWKERPKGRMQSASFSVSAPDGREAEAAILNLPGLGGHEAEVVNIWRGQLGLEPQSSADIAKMAERVAVGGVEASLYDLAGRQKQTDDKLAGRILVAMLVRPDGSWFFKLAGEDAFVREQKPAFLEFLKSITFEEGNSLVQAAAPGPPANIGPHPGPPAAELPRWEVPANWSEQPRSPIALASFRAADEAGGKADITVTMLAGDAGGTLANVNRWRGQLGLPPADQAELSRILTAVDAGGNKAVMVDLAGTDARTGRKARLVVATVPRGGSTWFYKLMGDEKVVAREKESFLKFFQGVRYPNG